MVGVATAACGAAVAAAPADFPQPGVPAAPASPAAAPAAPAAPLPPAAPGGWNARSDDQGNVTWTGSLSDAERRRLDAQLESAKQQLAATSAEVARLSTQLSGPFLQGLNMFGDWRAHSLIGINIANDNDPAGARVLDVSPGGPAWDAGLRSGDRIVAIDGEDTRGQGSSRKILAAIRSASADAKLKVRVLREGKSHEFTVSPRPVASTNIFSMLTGGPTTRAMGGGGGVVSFALQGVPGLMNMELASLTPQLGHYFGTDKGVLVIRAPADSRFKLQDGDVILTIDGRAPTSGTHATRILSSYQPGEKVTLHVMRDRKALDLETKLPADGPAAFTVPIRPNLLGLSSLGSASGTS